MNPQITLTAIPNIPLIRPGDDLGDIVMNALAAADVQLLASDVLCLASKIVSKAEGRYVELSQVTPTADALAVGERCRKDPQLVQVILNESQGVSRLRPGLLITRHKLGFICANAGVDRSNINKGEETVLLLPADPDASAAELRQQIQQATGFELAVVIVDSHGRPHRMGTVGVAIGAAGLPALQDWRGRPDLFGRELQHTEVGLADQIASAASLLFGQAAEGTPVVLVRGLEFEAQGGQAKDLVRPAELDLYK